MITPWSATLVAFGAVCVSGQHVHGGGGPDHVDLVTFDGAKGTYYQWQALNDPVMGGKSYSTFTMDEANKLGHWVGEVKNVPSLNAPGFCKIQTQGFLFARFPDASAFSHLQLRLRSNVSYSGWKVAFAADTLSPTFHAFKARFEFAADGEWHTVAIPFSDFSDDWSSFTGDCFTKDPTGRQHICCTESTTNVCPTLRNLKDIKQMSIWAEGGAGAFDLEIGEIGAGFGETCSSSEYCCPDAKLCLTPSNISCADNAKACDGTDSPVCCPLTKICVKPGKPCTSPCQDSGTYCCPDAKHCLTPTNPGHFCGGASDCRSHEVCCPLTKLCVAVGDSCKPGDNPVAPWWPHEASEDLVV